MSLDFGRCSENSSIRIDYSKCNSCGICVEICKGNPLFMEDGKVKIDQNRLLGCIGCGQCVAACPFDCIEISGRDISMEDFYPLRIKSDRSDYESLFALLESRRSIREFKNLDISDDILQKIIEATATSPMGLPPSEVKLLVVNGKEKVRTLAFEMIDELKKQGTFYKPLFLNLLRPFISKGDYLALKNFIRPVINTYLEKKKEGIDWLLYSAPLVIYFYGSEFIDPADPYIAATNSVIAAQSLGLGTCFIGLSGYCFQYSKFLQKKYGIRKEDKKGIIVIYGYPKFNFKKGIKRRFASVKYV